MKKSKLELFFSRVVQQRLISVISSEDSYQKLLLSRLGLFEAQRHSVSRGPVADEVPVATGYHQFQVGGRALLPVGGAWRDAQRRRASGSVPATHSGADSRCSCTRGACGRLGVGSGAAGDRAGHGRGGCFQGLNRKLLPCSMSTETGTRSKDSAKPRCFRFFFCCDNGLR